jgi:prepilin-type N-terminal cleavage/methylation domain-containing protein
MRQQPATRSKRSGFTLVELMVVILIITVLSALLAMAVSRALAAGKRTRNQIEIRQLAAAVDAFKTAYRVDYIPSKLFLSENGQAYSNANVAIYRDSLAYLQRIWPRLTFPAGGGIDWNGNGKIDPPVNGPGNGDVFLTGDQCLVFFLGGIPTSDSATGVPICSGFSTNPANPAAHLLPGGAAPKPPLYEFDSGRLVRGYNPNTPLFFSYLDTYGNSKDGQGGWAPGLGQPYLYFSSYRVRNGYNNTDYFPPDCQGFDPIAGVLKPVYPYAQGVNQYLNPSGFQIISAGADKLFGPGTANPSSTSGGPFWSPATAGGSGASGVNGADDQSNFYDSLLGNSSIN